jgi:uncharacterized membrane protein YbhN (UPF0104 family)
LLIGIALLPTFINFSELLVVFQTNKPHLLASGIIVSGVATIFLGIRMKKLLQMVGVDITLLTSYKINLETLFYSVFIPSQLGAEAIKFAKILKLNTSFEKNNILLGLILDKLIGFGTFLFLSLISFFALRDTIGTFIDSFKANLYFLSLAIFLILTLSFIVIKILFKNISRLSPFGAKNKISLTASCIIISITMQLLMCFSLFFAAKSFNINICFTKVVFVLSTSLCFQILPISIAGIYVSEAAGIFMYLALGLTRPESLVLVASNYLFRIINSLIGGVFEFEETIKKSPIVK